MVFQRRVQTRLIAWDGGQVSEAGRRCLLPWWGTRKGVVTGMSAGWT